MDSVQFLFWIIFEK